MGKIGLRESERNNISSPITKPKRKRDNTTHHQMCCQVAKWLQGRWSGKKPYAHYVAVELVTQGYENTDVFGFNPTYSTMIEIKVSRTDFLRDKQKYSNKFGRVGDYKYYCCPKDIIKVNDLPDKWGLLYIDDNGEIDLIKMADETDTNLYTERSIICSIMRREGIKKQVFNYRNNEDK